MKIIFAWGWTWWHIFPSLAIANNLKWEKLFLISKNNLDEEILKKTKFSYKKISSWKLRRYFSSENFIDIFKFIFGFFESLKIISKFDPDLIFCKWGFVSLPVAIAWKILWKKIVLHESDSVMWISNKIISKFATKFFYWEEIWNPINFFGKKFSEIDKKFFIAEKIFPILQKKFPDLEKNFFDNKKILFVSWGSQGAVEINYLLEKRLEKISEFFFVIHLTWKWKKIHVSKKIEKNYLWFEFLSWDEYFNFLQVADLLISRAWAWSIAEILFFQKPSILIPLKSSAWNHQVKNAEKLEKNWLAKFFRNYFLEIINSDFSEIEKNLKEKNFQNPAKKIAEEVIKIID